MLDEERKWIVMVAIYHKSDYKNEHSIQKMIKENLRSLLEHLSSKQVDPISN